MKVWLVSVAVLFLLAEIYLWVKDFILPLPIYLIGGAFLAIASNYDKGIMIPLSQNLDKTSDHLSQTATLLEVDKIKPEAVNAPLPSQETQN